jgi:hypothetical protein
MPWINLVSLILVAVVIHTFVCLVIGFWMLVKYGTSKPSSWKKLLLLLYPQRTLPDAITSYYRYIGEGMSLFLKDCFLSPKGCCVKKDQIEKFVVCESCRHSLRDKSVVPEQSICNGYELGVPPTELE